MKTTTKRFINSGLVLLIATVAAGCATNDLNIVQESEGEHVLFSCEFGESNRAFVSAVGLLDSTVSTRIDFERAPSSVKVLETKTGKEFVHLEAGTETMAWQITPLGKGKTMRLTIKVKTPSEVPFVGSALPETEEVWLAVLVNDRLVDLDEYLDGCASEEDGDDAPVARPRRPAPRETDEDAPVARRRASREDRDDRTAQRSGRPRRRAHGTGLMSVDTTSAAAREKADEEKPTEPVVALAAEDEFSGR